MKKQKIDRSIQNHYQLGSSNADQYFEANKDKILKDISDVNQKYQDALFILNCHKTASDYVIKKMQANEISAFQHGSELFSIEKKFSYLNLKVTKIENLS